MESQFFHRQVHLRVPQSVVLFKYDGVNASDFVIVGNRDVPASVVVDEVFLFAMFADSQLGNASVVFDAVFAAYLVMLNPIIVSDLAVVRPNRSFVPHNCILLKNVGVPFGKYIFPYHSIYSKSFLRYIVHNHSGRKIAVIVHITEVLQ